MEKWTQVYDPLKTVFSGMPDYLLSDFVTLAAHRYGQTLR